MANLKTNKPEQEVLNKYTDLGYDYLTKGYPDFCFFKVLADGRIEAIFVEVKPLKHRNSVNKGLSAHQKKMINIFRRLGMIVRIEYV
jgi:hypothetical protein